jgi:hypothetical protein
MRVGEGQWLVHNNGGFPFRVTRHPDLRVVVEALQFHEDHQPPNVLVDRVVFDEHVEWLAVGEDADHPDCEGFAVLAGWPGKVLVVSGGKAIVLTLRADEVVEPRIWSTSTSSDVWYTAFRTSKGTYLPDSGNDELPPHKPLVWVPNDTGGLDPYEFAWEEDVPGRHGDLLCAVAL